MIAYRYDSNGIYIGTQECQINPVASKRAGKEIYLLPANCTYTEPLEAKEGFDVVFNDGEWQYREIPKEDPQEEVKEPTIEEGNQQQHENPLDTINDTLLGIMETIEMQEEEINAQNDTLLAILEMLEE